MHFTGLVMWDSIGSICVGAMMGATAWFLISRNRQMLIGAPRLLVSTDAGGRPHALHTIPAHLPRHVACNVPSRSPCPHGPDALVVVTGRSMDSKDMQDIIRHLEADPVVEVGCLLASTHVV